MVATNIFHRGVAIGSSAAVQSPAGAAWTFSVDGEVVREGDASDYPIADMIHVVADTLEAAGEQLEAGDRIIAGALAPPPDVQAGSAADAGPRPAGGDRGPAHRLNQAGARRPSGSSTTTVPAILSHSSWFLSSQVSQK